MDRRGFITTGVAAGLVGLSGRATALEAAVSRGGVLRRRARPAGPANGVIKLSSNENPAGLSPAARDAVTEALGVANRYPRETRTRMVEAVARYHGVPKESVVLGAGSTEVLQMSVQALQAPRARLVIADPTFEDVPRYQRPFAYELVKVPLDARYAHDLGHMREIAEEAWRPSVVYLCNPNNPTGTLTPSDEIDAWIRSAHESTFFLVDEAYFEYAGDPAYHTALPWIPEHPNVIVVRTFSKIYGMAGMRLGYGLAHPDTARRLRDFISANNANQLALAAGLACLGDEELIRRSVRLNATALGIARSTLDDLGLEYLPTQTNFLMHRIAGDLEAYRKRMLDAGIRVGRPFPPMLEWNRVSIGLPEEMARWADTLRDFRKKGWV